MQPAIRIHVEPLPEGLYLATPEQLPGLVAQGRTVAETLEIARGRHETDRDPGAPQMKRIYSIAIEGQPGSYSAYIPELPAILVTGESIEELTARARQAIRLYCESVRAEVPPASTRREIEVELPA
jgi:predicted RNase H-like HicB family nuclease